MDSINNLGYEIIQNENQKLLKMENLFNERKKESMIESLKEQIDKIKNDIDRNTRKILTINKKIESNNASLEILDNFDKYLIKNDNVKKEEIKKAEQKLKRQFTNAARFEYDKNKKADEADRLKEDNEELIITRQKLREEIANWEVQLKELKVSYKKVRNDLLLHYFTILKEGKDTRNEGLSWVIKAIWKLESNVMISQLPKFLDAQAIEYIFKIARLDLEIKELKQKLDEIRINLRIMVKKSKSVKKRSLIGNTLFTTEQKGAFSKNSLDKYLMKLQEQRENISIKELNEFLTKRETLNEKVATLAFKVKEIEENYQNKKNQYIMLRTKELDRINIEFLFGDYSRRFEHVALKLVAAAIVGQDCSQIEVVRHKKDYKVIIFLFRHIMIE
jgi:hypothetical protein